jgi:2-dehydro-3-deoxygluconokinase
MSGIDDYDWNVILPQDDSITHGNAFFWTGITPAVGENLPGILRDALEVCRSRKIRTYCDLNYRAALWTTEKAGSVLRDLLPYTDVCVANEEHAEQLFGITTSFTEQNDRIRDIAEKMCAKFGHSRVVMTMRRSLSADDNEVSAATLNAKTGEFTVSRTYPVHIIDRVGGGDALSAGIIYGEIHGFDEAHLIEFASAANAFKHSIHGDALIASAAEIEAIAMAKTGEIRMKR